MWEGNNEPLSSSTRVSVIGLPRHTGWSAPASPHDSGTPVLVHFQQGDDIFTSAFLWLYLIICLQYHCPPHWEWELGGEIIKPEEKSYLGSHILLYK